MKLSFLVVVSTLSLASAQAFHKSCRNFRLTANKRLGCQCKNKQGIWKNNEFDLNMVLGVEKGALVYKRWGMYYDICYGVDIIDVSKDYGIGWEAFCGRMEINGKWYDYPSRIMLSDFIGNIDGCLKDRNFGMEARCW